jgi:hypothetical protein
MIEFIIKPYPLEIITNGNYISFEICNKSNIPYLNIKEF